MSSSLITIDGSETPVGSPETVFVTDCEYPVVTVGEVFGTSSGSYILDPEGSLVLKADQEILYADSSCYMYYNNDQLYSRIETGAVIRKTLSVQLFPGCLATNFFASNTFMFSSFSN